MIEIIINPSTLVTKADTQKMITQSERERREKRKARHIPHYTLREMDDVDTNY